MGEMMKKDKYEDEISGWNTRIAKKEKELNRATESLNSLKRDKKNVSKEMQQLEKQIEFLNHIQHFLAGERIPLSKWKALKPFYQLWDPNKEKPSMASGQDFDNKNLNHVIEMLYFYFVSYNEGNCDRSVCASTLAEMFE